MDEIALPSYALFEACGRVILIAEAYAVHEQDLKNRPLAYGRFAYQRIAAGAALSAADLMQAYRARVELTEAVDAVLASHDGLLSSCGLTAAPRFDQFDRDVTRWTAMQTIPFNVTGHPALALPIGFSSDGLPLGAQIVGRHFDEATVLRIAAAYEAEAALKTLAG